MTRRVALALVLGAVLAPPLDAQYPAEVETEAARIFNSTMSPFCPGLLLANCPSSQAADLKAEIRAKLAAGVAPDSIRAELYARFGDQVRATPPASGFGLVAWIVPALVIVVAAVIVVRRLRRSAGTADTRSTAPTDELDRESQARIERELGGL